MTPDVVILAVLVLWGAVVGMDLVSFPQALLNRPLVAGAVAGLLTGDLDNGLRVGMVLELFALEILPIGASRYPDYGPSAVVATALVSGVPWREALGPAVMLGLVLALVAGWGIELLRRVNGRRVRLAEAELAAGDPGVLARLHRLGMLGDALRGGLLTAVGLAVWLLARDLIAAPPSVGPTLTLVAVGGGLVAAAGGVARRAAHGKPRLAAVAGVAMGAVIAWLWV